MPDTADANQARTQAYRTVNRRELILQTTLQLIARGGIDVVTHRRVADAAGIPLGSTTYYFQSRDHLLRDTFDFYIEKAKRLQRPPDNINSIAALVRYLVDITNREFEEEEMLLALLQRYFDDIRARISAIPAPHTLDQFMMGLRLSMPVDRLAATRLFFDVLGPGFQDPRAAEIIGGFFDWLADHYADQFAPLIRAGEIRSDLSAQAAAQAVTAMLDGLVIHLAIFGVEEDVFETRRDATLALLETGLRGGAATAG